MKSLVIFFLVAMSGLACAQESSNSSGRGGPRGNGGQPPTPPAEAFTVCQGKSSGTQVSITMPDGRTMQATCEPFPGDGRLAARPERPPQGERPSR